MEKQLIYKYSIDLRSQQNLSLPLGSIPLAATLLNGNAVVYCRVSENDTEKENINIYVLWTGEAIESDKKYLGTFIVSGLVYHVFWDKENKLPHSAAF